MSDNKDVVTNSTTTTLCSKYKENNKIAKELFSKYEIKQGLRNNDGTGVLAGITNISNVHGYLINEGEREPIEGKLTYRGINIYDLVDGFEDEKRFGFDEISYLLLIGKLPMEEELKEYMEIIASSRNLPQNFTEDIIMRVPGHDIMNKLALSTMALYGYDEDPDNTSVENVLRQGIELIARFPIIISHAYQARRRYYSNKSMFLHVPDPLKSTAENILTLIRPDGKYTDEEARLLDLALCVHAEHGGGNNSAFVTRAVSSSDTDTYSAISAAVGALKGSKHGGANIKVRKMFDEIAANISDERTDEEVLAYLRKILRKEAGDGSGLIYGMGHAIYMVSDPRAVILKKNAESLAIQKGLHKDFLLLDAIERLTKQAFIDERGVDRAICANVDLYSGFVYKMLDLPKAMYTPLFATARIVGWMAHRLEEISTSNKIIRPAYKPINKTGKYIPLSSRDLK